jgi:hypothetical protein
MVHVATAKSVTEEGVELEMIPRKMGLKKR